MINIAAKWNALDSFIYKIESSVAQLSDAAKASKNDLPDPEEMIAAATKQLQYENAKLKKKQYPSILIEENNQYYCPDCHELLSKELIKKKFCPECGKRIVLQKDIYATSHKE